MDLVGGLLILGICFSGCGAGPRSSTILPTEPGNCNVEGLCVNNAVCRGIPGNYSCRCKPGYKSLSGSDTFTNLTESCDDFNECTQKPIPIECGPRAECKNIPGSYYCRCLQGYQTKSGKEHFKIKNEMTCEDVDECRNSSICPKYSFCNNTIGSYFCECEDGYTSKSGKRTFISGETQCQDIDECKQNSTICLPHGSCINIPGDYVCNCHPGAVKSIKNPRKLCQGFNTCIMINSNYSCVCREGYINSNKLLPQNNNKPTCIRFRCRSSNYSQQAGCDKKSTNLLCSLKKYINSLLPDCSSLKHQSKQGEKLLQNILNEVDKELSQVNWNTNQFRYQQASEVVQLVEETAKDFMWLLEDGTTDIKNMSKLSIWKGNNSLKGPISLNQEGVRMDLNWETAAGSNNNGFAVMGLLTIKDMETVLSNASLKGWNKSAETRGKEEPRVISKVVTAFVSSEEASHLNSPVNFTFSHQNSGKGKTICAFWSYNEHRWSEEGCCKVRSTAEETVCACNHLSSFAVLMAHYQIQDWRLTVITYVGLVISLFCLLLSIITFMFCRILKGTRNTIHLYLCISLFLAHAIFLIGISRTSNQTACSVVAGLLHFFFLASFCWMCLEGVELYLMVVQVFKTHTLKKRYMFLAGYGIPALIVAISAAANSKGYGTIHHCWLSLEGGFLWSFLAPVCLIILVNAVIFVITVWKLAQKFSTINPDVGKLKTIRTFTITAIAQLCILGLTWIIGIFQFSDETLVMSYIFVILNSFQGLFIFLLHCLLKKQVREQYHRWIYAAFRLKEPDKYSPFTSSAGPLSSASQSRGTQSSKESGM